MKNLKLNESHLRILLDSAPMGIIMIEKSGEIVDVNPRLCSMFGYDPEEIIGKMIEHLLPERFRAGHAHNRDYFFSKPVARLMGKNRDLYGLRKDNSEFPVEIGLGHVKTDDSELSSAFVIDVTSRMEAETKARRLYDEIQEVSVPIMKVWDGVLVLPLIGTLDSYRTQNAMEKTLNKMADDKVKVLIIDITGVPVVDTMVANHLLRLASAIRLMGGHSILTGISPSIARTIVQLGVDLSELNTRPSLARGLQLAIDICRKELR